MQEVTTAILISGELYTKTMGTIGGYFDAGMRNPSPLHAILNRSGRQESTKDEETMRFPALTFGSRLVMKTHGRDGFLTPAVPHSTVLVHYRAALMAARSCCRYASSAPGCVERSGCERTARPARRDRGFISSHNCIFTLAYLPLIRAITHCQNKIISNKRARIEWKPNNGLFFAVSTKQILKLLNKGQLCSACETQVVMDK